MIVHLGAHVSIAGGVEHAPLRAADIGANAFALFTKNQRQWQAKALTEESIAAFGRNCRQIGIGPRHIVAHDSYLINLGHPDQESLAKSRHAFDDEMQRCRQLGIELLNFHPGSHLNTISEEACLARIAESINLAHARTAQVVTVIENTAGQGSNVGYRFEHLARIIEGVEDRSRVGVCLDTCHTFVAGYDIGNAKGYEAVLREFDRVVGLEFLRALHLNDCKKPLGSRVDRHASIGAGALGRDPFSFLVNDPRLRGLPMILETPDDSLWAAEITLLRGMAGQIAEMKPAASPKG